ncbi:ADPRM-like protein [Mya arenaria]|uniref:ADPRM-like protein n=1 Tax=Mya arenaria TaxID=6604 RepID=A0ABY7DCL9_MYAAR|nr:ADPRM-like protein [Mya arenaria]
MFYRTPNIPDIIRNSFLGRLRWRDVQYANIEDGYNFAKTTRRYYRTALPMLTRAIDSWKSDGVCKPQFVLQLGDALDGKNKGHNISESSLTSVVNEFSKFKGPMYHIWGNHEYYNFSRQQLMSSPLYSGKEQNAIPVEGKAYYAVIPHSKLRILALDCYEISQLASPHGSLEYTQACEYMANNVNEDQNSSIGLEGVNRRFVKYNGAFSEEQIIWIDSNLGEAEELKQNVIIIGHCGICPGATDDSCLCWNFPDVLSVIQSRPCVLAYLSGHDHSGGRNVDEHGILHMAYPGVLENNVESDFGTCYMYSDKLVMKGNGRVPNLELNLRYKIDS